MGIPVEQILIQTLNGIVTGMILALVASGLTLIFGLMNILNLAHGAFFTLGAYCGVVVGNFTGSFWLALLVVPPGLARSDGPEACNAPSTKRPVWQLTGKKKSDRVYCVEFAIDARPSDSDFRATRRLATAAEALDCTVLDHLIFGGAECTSLRGLGYL